MGSGESKPIVYFTLIEAKDIPKMDVMGKSDPYCLISIHHPGERRKRNRKSKPFKSKRFTNTEHAKWNENYVFEAIDTEQDYIKVILKDHDTISKDDKIGTLKIPISLIELKNGTTIEKWVEMNPAKGITGKAKLHYTIRVDFNP